MRKMEKSSFVMISSDEVYMDYESHSSEWPPICWCKTCHMVILQAGTIKNPGSREWFGTESRTLSIPRRACGKHGER
ncbi:hypothetical protein ACS0TY_014105 [Phlomoides rotata]